MIQTFAHKGLRKFFETGSAAGVQAKHVTKLRMVLSALQRAAKAEDMTFQGARLHPLRGELKGYWAVTVQANWRIIFRFENGRAYDVDYVDYH